MMEIKDPENFKRIKEAITDLVGFDCSQYTDSFLQRRIEVRLRATEIKSLREYLYLLKSSEEEKKKINKELSIHVTNFFRDKTMWETFKDDVIPLLINLKKESDDKNIKIWSAGCSSGEEALSIAISFIEKLGSNLRGFNLTILGSDIDKPTVERARNAVYDEIQFREMKPEYKARYFENIDEGTYKAKEEIKKFTEFKVMDLFSSFKPKEIDILFCRNTVIYFNIDAKSKLYEDFYRCISSSGFFIMGKTEVLQGPAREKFQIFNGKERIYFKE